MRVAVIGGTGLVGGHTVRALRASGHDPVVVARSTGVDVTTGRGLDEALRGADAVIDVTNTAAQGADEARDFFVTSTRRLLAAEERMGVDHHVVLSIVGLDRVAGNAYYAAKRAQEEAAAQGPVPVTIQRATQFHEFADMVVSWTRRDDMAVVPPLLVQSVAAADVGQVLTEVAVGAPQGRARDLAGPEQQDLVDMARRSLAARRETLRLVPSWSAGPFGTEMAGDVLLPASDARLAPTTFATWLARRHNGLATEQRTEGDFSWVHDAAAVRFDELSELYRLAPLGDKPPDALATVFGNSRFVCFVYTGGALVGAGRVLADGLDCAYIADVAVHPSHQGRGLGKAIIERLVESAQGHKKIILYANPGTEAFYSRLGFLRMNTAMAIWQNPTRAVESGLLSAGAGAATSR